MREMRFEHDGITYKRISKMTARRAYNNGLSVVFCPCNLRPFGMWHPEYVTRKDAEPDDRTFERLIDELEFYGCSDRETGKYLAYYIPVRWVDRFSGEPTTPGSYGAIEQYDHGAIQWETWTA